MDNYILTYYQGIKDGTYTVGKWIRLLYEKVLADLESKETYYNHKEASRAIEWIENHCFHTEGALAPGPFLLEPWEKAFLSCVFGIYDTETQKRRYRECLLVVARKNGKSMIASSVARYLWAGEAGGFGSKVFCISPKLDQAAIVYDNIWMMTTMDPEWQALRDQVQSTKDGRGNKTMDDSMLARHRQTDLFIPGINSTVKKIAFSAKKSDGFNPSLTICDEVAAWEGDKGLKQYEVMKSAMGAREIGDNPGLLLACTTAGYINDGIYDELMKRGTRYLLGDSKEKRLLPVIYQIDDITKWNDVNELQKSCPNLGVSLTVDYLLEEIAIAEGSLSRKAEFITKMCNIKQNSSLAWLSAETVEGMMPCDLTIEDMRSHYAVGGIDLSRTTDLTAACVVIEKDGEFYIHGHAWLPGEKIDEASQRDGLPYQAYVERGLLSPSGDTIIDYHDVYRWFTDLIEKYEILPLKVGYDRYSAQYLVQDMAAYGFNMDDVYQGDNLYGIIKEFEAHAEAGRVHIMGNNDLMKVHFLDSAVKMSVERGRGKLVKLAPTSHIDLTASVIDAFTVREKWWPEVGEQLENKGK